MSTKYEVVPGPGANRTVLGLSSGVQQKELAHSLMTELVDGPNADKEVQFDVDGVHYTATPLSFGGYVAIHRPMTREELKRLGREQGRRIASQGFFVPDILPPGSAVTAGPRIL